MQRDFVRHLACWPSSLHSTPSLSLSLPLDQVNVEFRKFFACVPQAISRKVFHTYTLHIYNYTLRLLILSLPYSHSSLIYGFIRLFLVLALHILSFFLSFFNPSLVGSDEVVLNSNQPTKLGGERTREKCMGSRLCCKVHNFFFELIVLIIEGNKGWAKVIIKSSEERFCSNRVPLQDSDPILAITAKKMPG